MTRHVLVHRGGVVDGSFVSRVKKHPHLSKLKENERLNFDGVFASQAAEVALVCGLTLLDHVDDWLMANPK